MRRGAAVDPDDAPVAYALATRELDRLTAVVRPARLTVWRILHAAFAASALRAPQRLDRQVARLALARDRNAPAGTAGTA